MVTKQEIMARAARRQRKVAKKAKKEVKEEPTVEDTTVEEKGDGRCQATTASGNQCKNKALEGSDFCGIHQPEDEE